MHLCISRTTFSLKAFGPWLTLLSLANSAMSQILEAARMINGHKVVEGMDASTHTRTQLESCGWDGEYESEVVVVCQGCARGG